MALLSRIFCATDAVALCMRRPRDPQMSASVHMCACVPRVRHVRRVEARGASDGDGIHLAADLHRDRGRKIGRHRGRRDVAGPVQHAAHGKLEGGAATAKDQVDRARRRRPRCRLNRQLHIRCARLPPRPVHVPATTVSASQGGHDAVRFPDPLVAF